MSITHTYIRARKHVWNNKHIFFNRGSGWRHHLKFHWICFSRRWWVRKIKLFVSIFVTLLMTFISYLSADCFEEYVFTHVWSFIFESAGCVDVFCGRDCQSFAKSYNADEERVDAALVWRKHICLKQLRRGTNIWRIIRDTSIFEY
jgi:hypothetical protein